MDQLGSVIAISNASGEVGERRTDSGLSHAQSMIEWKHELDDSRNA